MEYSQAEILQTVAMTEMEHLDVRTVTLGLSLLDCTSDSLAGVAQKAGDKIRKFAARLVPAVDEIGEQFGIRVANKRISITPVSLITEGLRGDLVHVARAIDDAAGTVGVDFIGGYSFRDSVSRFDSRSTIDYRTPVFVGQRSDDACRNQHGRGGPCWQDHQGRCRKNSRPGRTRVCEVCLFRQRSRRQSR